MSDLGISSSERKNREAGYTLSALTIDTQASSAAAVNNACRSAQWYDADGNHLNPAKALFCCGAPPPDNNGELDMAASAAALAAIEPAAGGGADFRQGSFSIPHY